MTGEAVSEAGIRQELEVARQDAVQSRAALDELAHAVSHDLRAPLRAISTFSAWLERDLKDLLEGETQEYMRLLRSRTLHMERLIDGMLRYSRIAVGAALPCAVEVGDLVDGIAEELGAPTGSIIKGYLPTFCTDADALRQVLHNLIENGLRFGGAAARVEVSARDAGTRFEFSVSDNGPGVPPRLRDRVFLLFQTAQPPDSDGSTGVGLAIAKKIVERYGGTIHVDPDATSGATFRFSWPMELNES